jgi:hypothetical protein
MEETTQQYIKDAKVLNKLANQWPDQDSAPALLRNAQIEMVIRDYVRAVTNEQIDILRKSTAEEIWNRATAHLK